MQPTGKRLLCNIKGFYLMWRKEISGKQYLYFREKAHLPTPSQPKSSTRSDALLRPSVETAAPSGRPCPAVPLPGRAEAGHRPPPTRSATTRPWCRHAARPIESFWRRTAAGGLGCPAPHLGTRARAAARGSASCRRRRLLRASVRFQGARRSRLPDPALLLRSPRLGTHPHAAGVPAPKLHRGAGRGQPRREAARGGNGETPREGSAEERGILVLRRDPRHDVTAWHWGRVWVTAWVVRSKAGRLNRGKRAEETKRHEEKSKALAIKIRKGIV